MNDLTLVYAVVFTKVRKYQDPTYSVEVLTVGELIEYDREVRERPIKFKGYITRSEVLNYFTDGDVAETAAKALTDVYMAEMMCGLGSDPSEVLTWFKNCSSYKDCSDSDDF